MKKTSENRYPHSATLFRFCKEALELKYEGNVKVIDQDVGAILGYDPADCSHWKKGKKNIRALGTLKSISDHLNIDERLLIDIAAGKVEVAEAVFEYKGYGTFALGGQQLENSKKAFFKNPGKWQKEGQQRTFEELFFVDREAILELAQGILRLGHFDEAPIYLPEIYQLFDGVELKQDSSLQDNLRVDKSFSDSGKERWVVSYPEGEMKSFLRFLLAKNLFLYLLTSKADLRNKFIDLPDEIIDIHANIFASLILIPSNLLQQEVAKIDCSADIVSQLADIFWVSKALLNQRIGDYLESGN